MEPFEDIKDFSHRPWVQPVDVDIPPALFHMVGGNRLVTEILFRRGFRDPSTICGFLDPDKYSPASPYELPDMEIAVERLVKAVKHEESIAVWGDFDVDGQTATTILVSILRDLGAQVMYHIPVRENESHGVNIPHLKPLIESGARVLLTCDTGISAHEAVDFATNRGLDVLITDHHDLAADLPSAEAVVNPKRLPAAHPLAALPGVGVAYQLMHGLCLRLGKEDMIEACLDLAALGIVADLASLTGDTRYLLQLGLKGLRSTQRLGLNSLFESSGLMKEGLSEEHIGFILGPRLNALGRLGDANWIVEFFTTQDSGRARIMALQLEGLNQQRKLITDQVFKGAMAQLDRDPTLLADHALVMAHPNWPAGVIGIVASRLVDHYHRPVILISTPPGEPGRGSARSINGINIMTAIIEQKDKLLGFGGHPMAAGLSIDPQNIAGFRKGFLESIKKQIGDIPSAPPLQIDGYLSLENINMELVADLDRVAPFGPGNPNLTFVARNVKMIKHRSIGKDLDHILLSVQDPGGFEKEIIWWQGVGWDLPEGLFDLAFTVHANSYRGEQTVQVEWVDSRPSQDTPISVVGPRHQILDYRQEPSPLSRLKELQEEGDVQVWREGLAFKEIPGQTRLELIPARTLIVWTIPPGRDELLQAIDRVQPVRIVLFANEPDVCKAEAFLQQLSGHVKYILKEPPNVSSLSALAAATAQRIEVVRKGLEYLAARGLIIVNYLEEGDRLQLSHPENARPTKEGLVLLKEELRLLMEETCSFRKYFLRCDPESLL